MLVLGTCSKQRKALHGPFFFLAVLKAKLTDGICGESALSVPSQESLIKSLSETAEKHRKHIEEA